MNTKQNYLENALYNMQVEYCNILKSAQKGLNTDDFMFVIDEVNLFWYANRNKIKMILDYLLSNGDCFMHTGATFLDVGAFEHFPFVMLGEYHIIDDPVANFGESLSKLENRNFKKYLNKQIKLTVEQNINIIENHSDIIQILPIRFINNSGRKYSLKASQDAFLSLFKNEKLTVEKYLNLYKSIEDIDVNLKEYCKEIIIFTDTDKNDSLINRFKAFLNKTDIFQSNKTDAEIFMATLVGYFMQAFDIILVCLKYNLQPYLRYIIPFHNILLLAHSLPQDPEIKKILLNAKISYLLHHSVDFDIFKDLNFNEFYKKIKTTGFEDKIKNEITHKIKNNNQKDICINEYGKIIKTNLDYLFLNL